MANMEVTNNDTGSLVLWDPVFDDAKVVSAAAVTLPSGTLLGRITASGNLAKYTTAADEGAGTDVPKAVLRCDVELEAGVPMPMKVIVNGRLKRNDLLSDGNPITDAEADALRDYGIVTLSTTELAMLDNQ